MFSKAKTVAPAATTAKGRASKKPVDVLPGLQQVAALDACAKAISGLLTLKKDQLREAAISLLVERGVKRQSKPEFLSLAEGEFATGRASITKRSTASPLTQDELEQIAAVVGGAERDEAGMITGIEGFAETSEKSPEMFAVNPVHAKDELLLARVEKALSKVTGIPEDFIIRIEADAKVVVSDLATDAVFRLRPADVDQAFRLIAGVSVSASHRDIASAWELIRPLLQPDVKAELGAMLEKSVQ